MGAEGGWVCDLDTLGVGVEPELQGCFGALRNLTESIKGSQHGAFRSPAVKQSKHRARKQMGSQEGSSGPSGMRSQLGEASCLGQVFGTLASLCLALFRECRVQYSCSLASFVIIEYALGTFSVRGTVIGPGKPQVNHMHPAGTGLPVSAGSYRCYRCNGWGRRLSWPAGGHCPCP